MDAGNWNEAAYTAQGFGAQRLYPNEELLRFMGRNFFGIPREQRTGIKILEAGCGSGSNLWMLAHEGFDAHGIDISPAGVALCRKMLATWGVAATIGVADMTRLPHSPETFNAVLDVFSAYSLTNTQFDLFAAETARVLKPGGVFFSYTPSKASDAFRDPGTAQMLDGGTLDGITRETSAYHGSNHPFRFVEAAEYATALARHGLAVTYSETVGRTYRHGAEYFEWVVVEAHKPA